MQVLDAVEQRAQLLELGRARLQVLKMRDFDEQIFALRQELVQRRIEQANRDGQRLHGLEETDEILPLHGEQLLECVAAGVFGIRENHGADVLDAALSEEHVLGAAEADAFRPEGTGLLGVARHIGIGADLELAQRVGPTHELDEIGIVGTRGNRLQLALDDAARGAVERYPVAVAEGLALDAQFLAGLVHLAVACAGNAALTHAAGDDGGVRGHAAARGENAGRDFHATDVLGRGLATDEDDGVHVAVHVRLHSFFRGEDNLAYRRAG